MKNSSFFSFYYHHTKQDNFNQNSYVLPPPNIIYQHMNLMKNSYLLEQTIYDISYIYEPTTIE